MNFLQTVLEHFFYAITMTIVLAIPVCAIILMLEPYFR